MERAKELLMDGSIKIQWIAERLGYADSNYFSKAFRNYYGITPTQFRKDNNIYSS
jgi:two-component system response regulator YesN